MICARRPCQLRAMSSLQGDGQQQICQQGTININYTLELYCSAPRNGRITSYQLPSRLELGNTVWRVNVLLPVSDRNKTGKICYELHDRLYCCLVSLFSCIDLGSLSVL